MRAPLSSPRQPPLAALGAHAEALGSRARPMRELLAQERLGALVRPRLAIAGGQARGHRRLRLTETKRRYLGGLLDARRRSEAAIECLRKALHVAPDYVDAIFNLALLSQRKNQYADGHWSHLRRRFLPLPMT